MFTWNNKVGNYQGEVNQQNGDSHGYGVWESKDSSTRVYGSWIENHLVKGYKISNNNTSND